MKKLWQDEAWEEYIGWQTEDKKTLKKIKLVWNDKFDKNGSCT
jgi:toxin YoeB